MAGRHRVGIIRSCLVTDDAERDWPAVGKPSAGGWRSTAASSPGGDRQRGPGHHPGKSYPADLGVGDVEHCVAELSAFMHEYGITDIVTWGVPPGMRAGSNGPSLERLCVTWRRGCVSGRGEVNAYTVCPRIPMIAARAAAARC